MNTYQKTALLKLTTYGNPAVNSPITLATSTPPNQKNLLTTKMGTSNTKEASQNGDQDVTIIENQEVHTGLLEDHDWKLNLILIIVTLQLIIGILATLRRQWKKTAIRAAQSVAALDV